MMARSIAGHWIFDLDALHAQQAEAHEQRLAHAQPVECGGQRDNVQDD